MAESLIRILPQTMIYEEVREARYSRCSHSAYSPAIAAGCFCTLRGAGEQRRRVCGRRLMRCGYTAAAAQARFCGHKKTPPGWGERFSFGF